MKNEDVLESLSDAAREAMGHEDATQAMKDSGNYKKGHCRIAGFDVTIEQPAGSFRQGVDPDGTPWKTRMNHHYGALKKTVGADGDHVDAFFNPDIADEEFENMPVFVIDQINKEGKFDESKCMFGFANKQEAKAAYISNYEPGWEGLGDIHQFDVDSFKSWVMDKAKTKRAVSSAVFEVAGDWRERIMGAGSFDEVEYELKTVFSLTSEDEGDNITIQNVSPADSNVTDGQTVTTWATKSKIEKYQKDAERLSKKAEKLGITDYVTIEKTGNVRNAYWVRVLVDVKRDGEHIYVEKLIPEGEKGIRDGEVVGMTKQYEVTVSGKPLKIEGWYVAGKAEHTMDDKGNYHALVRGYNIRKDDVKSCGPLCEHCGHKRRRNSTFILKNDQGEVKQVGSTCVDDFTGHEGADSIADLMGSSWKLFTIGDETEDGEYSGGDKISAYPVKAYIAHVVKVMESDKGYIPASEQGSTAYSALDSFFSDKVTGEHTQKAEEVLEWARSIENPDSAYMDNIKTLGSVEYFPKTLLGVAGSMVHAYNKSIARKIEDDSGLNEYFGNTGDKIKDIKAKIVSIKPIDSYYGRSYLYIFKADTGHTLKWFSSKDAGGEPGNSIMLSGTIKAHDEHNGRKQTAITRGKITVTEG